MVCNSHVQVCLEVKPGDWRIFPFDFVFDEQCSQSRLFDATVRPLLRRMLDDRCHATVFAYGQTRWVHARIC